MNDKRFQHLADAFNSIISMMLAEIRARGLRSLINLPQMILAAIYLRRLGKQFAALIASIDLSALPLPSTDQQAAPALSESSAQARQPLAVRALAPANASATHRARRATVVQPHSAAPKPSTGRTLTPRHQVARHPAFTRPRHALHPRATLSLPAILRETGRT